MKWWRRFWQDERGEVGLAGVVLLYAILVLGVIAGLTVVRNAIVHEFGDLATALMHVDTSYSFVAGGTTHQYLDTQTTSLDVATGQFPAGIVLTEPSGATPPP
jgi:Flp pilus assembly pilin Flp